jgi:hypothetical protein
LRAHEAQSAWTASPERNDANLRSDVKIIDDFGAETSGATTLRTSYSSPNPLLTPLSKTCQLDGDRAHSPASQRETGANACHFRAKHRNSPVIVICIALSVSTVRTVYAVNSHSSSQAMKMPGKRFLISPATTSIPNRRGCLRVPYALRVAGIPRAPHAYILLHNPTQPNIHDRTHHAAMRPTAQRWPDKLLAHHLFWRG